MPRFSTTSDVVLNSIISEMGAPLIFSNAADFRLMTEDNEQLFVSLMKQKAAIEVNEEGTKASAVTVSQMGYASIIPPDKTRKIDFHANRPFVYIIREASSGAVFFIGTYRGN
jgi:serpin B